LGGTVSDHKVAVIRGDGIGPELVDAALTVLRAAAEPGQFGLQFVDVDAGADTHRRTGRAISDESLAFIRDGVEVTLKGPVGLPTVRLPGGTEAGLLGGVLRNGLDLYANVRPITMLPGVVSPLGARPGEINYVIVRENTEGLYASRNNGVGNRWAMTDTLLVTRHGSARIAHYAFDLALKRSGAPADGRARVTCVDKSNVLRSYALFREVFEEVADDYPSVEAEFLYADAAAEALVQRPGHFDVLVMENFLGDLFSDLGGGTVGGIALCPSANIGLEHACFEPIHGSAPSIVGREMANPIAQILCAGLMLDHLKHEQEGDLVRRAVSAALAQGDVEVMRDGSARGGAQAVGRAVTHHLKVLAAVVHSGRPDS